ncbi:RCC1 domain-containing protein [Microbacterium sp. NPDC077663]|uniref:RCC1 domain-containing protein n=1 Tax=Microbacterium sp. NPDC077663 TaxID=3364189 RepID=UPI0037CB73EB
MIRVPVPRLLVVALATAIALGGTIGSTTAGFTAGDTSTGNSLTLGTLEPITITPDTPQSAAQSIDIAWAAPGLASPSYTVERSLSPDGAAPDTIATGLTEPAFTDTGHLEPTQIKQTFSSISAGDAFTAAVDEDGVVWAWGDNEYGQLGTGNNDSSTRPVRVDMAPLGGRVVTSLTTGARFTIAIASDDTVWAWGDNSWGQLGNGTQTSSNRPVQVDTSAFAGRHLVSVDGGSAHVASVADDGTVWSWGWGLGGELGVRLANGGLALTPVQIDTAPVGGRAFAQVSAGIWHTIARATDGTLWAWGGNMNGQFGIGTASDDASFAPVPTDMASFAGRTVTSVAAGGYHTLARTDDGTVWVWGEGTNGQLGIGNLESTLEPRQIDPASFGNRSLTDISASLYNSVATATDGSIWTWGGNQQGQLGTGSGVEISSIPVQVDTTAMPTQNPRAVSTYGLRVLVIAGDGTGWGWGRNSLGQLGNNTTIGAPTPTPVYQEPATECPPGASPTNDGKCTLTPDTTYYYRVSYTIGKWVSPPSAWVGLTTALAPLTPRLDPATSTGTQIGVTWNSAGSDTETTYTLERSLTADGANPTTVVEASATVGYVDSGPVPAAMIDVPLVSISSGYHFSAALGEDGAVWTWGDSSNGQLGRANPTNSNAPGPIADDAFGGRTITALSSGWNHTIALASDGTAWGWGYNGDGSLGNPAGGGQKPPTEVDATALGAATFTHITSGHYHNLALASDGTLWAWGGNSSGQLGIGTSTSSRDTARPVRVDTSMMGDRTIVALGAGSYRSAALTDDGTLWTWGDGITRPRQVATMDLQGRTIVSMSYGIRHLVALTDDGTVWTYGGNDSGQLGRAPGNLIDRVDPADFGSVPVTSVTAGGNTTAAVTADGHVYTWGENTWGHLGIGSTANASRPTLIDPEALGNQEVTHVALTRNAGFAVTSSGIRWAWGGTRYTLGLEGDIVSTTTPMQGLPAQRQECAPGATALPDQTCTLAPGTTYYYRLSYTSDGHPGPASPWTALTTPRP